MEDKELKIIEEKIELTLCEVLESKTYVEISLVTLFFMFISFFTEPKFIRYLQSNQIVAVIIIIFVSVLFFSIVYLFVYILKTKNKWDYLTKKKKDLDRDWTN